MYCTCVHCTNNQFTLACPPPPTYSPLPWLSFPDRLVECVLLQDGHQHTATHRTHAPRSPEAIETDRSVFNIHTSYSALGTNWTCTCTCTCTQWYVIHVQYCICTVVHTCVHVLNLTSTLYLQLSNNESTVRYTLYRYTKSWLHLMSCTRTCTCIPYMYILNMYTVHVHVEREVSRAYILLERCTQQSLFIIITFSLHSHIHVIYNNIIHVHRSVYTLYQRKGQQ